MANCDNQIGVRNIIITFIDCDSGTTYSSLAHDLAGDEQPQYKFCETNNVAMTGNYIKRTKSNNEISLTVIRNVGVPLALYQGCGAIDISIEHYNGTVITGLSGTAIGDDSSDGHEVTITATFKEIDELTPENAAS